MIQHKARKTAERLLIGKLELQRRRKTRERRKKNIMINRENGTKEKDRQQKKLYDLERSAITDEYYE